jgi:glycosyltransferase involved in cell wall biosynthesis
MFKPLVSIITPSLNQGHFIEETIRSVLSQDYPHVEYIVIDGGSTDGTLEILRKYSNNKVRWKSQPDLGQADAVNKGFSMAKGEILGWLNSDDTYMAGAVSTVVEYFLQNPGTVMAYGDAHFIDREGNVKGKYPSQRFRINHLAKRCFLSQPAVFIRTEVFKNIGPLDITLQTCMDYEYWIRIGQSYPETAIAYLKDNFLANSRSYGGNKSTRLREIHYREAMETAERYFGHVQPFWKVAYMIGRAEEKMKGFEKSNVMLRAILRMFYIGKIFGVRWACRYFKISFEEWLLGNLER